MTRVLLARFSRKSAIRMPRGRRELFPLPTVVAFFLRPPNIMEKQFLRSIAERLQKDRRALVEKRQRFDHTFQEVADSRETER